MALDYIGYAFAAAVGWGVGDFVVALSATKTGFFRTAILAQAVGGLLVFILAVPNLGIIVEFPQASLFSVGLGLVNVVAVMSAYKSFEVGKLSVVSPLSSSFPALSTILSVVVFGEVVSPLRAVGILLTLGGIVLVTAQAKNGSEMLHDQSERQRRLGKGVEYALIAFVAYGFLYFALKPAVDSLGPLAPVLIMRIVFVLVMGAIALFGGLQAKSTGVTRNIFLMIFIIGVSDIFAGVAYNLGVLGGEVSVVSTISGLYSVLTVVLAWAFLKERLTSRQDIGLIVLFIGVGMLGFTG